ncbi:MAG: hypothetical protein M1831_006498 [Alyxoria varia]|nr:MAG: hypothetical protein M1831_006498 [Alyxoria varia]
MATQFDEPKQSSTTPKNDQQSLILGAPHEVLTHIIRYCVADVIKTRNNRDPNSEQRNNLLELLTVCNEFHDASIFVLYREKSIHLKIQQTTHSEYEGHDCTASMVGGCFGVCNLPAPQQNDLHLSAQVIDRFRSIDIFVVLVREDDPEYPIFAICDFVNFCEPSARSSRGAKPLKSLSVIFELPRDETSILRILEPVQTALEAFRRLRNLEKVHLDTTEVRSPEGFYAAFSIRNVAGWKAHLQSEKDKLFEPARLEMMSRDG